MIGREWEIHQVYRLFSADCELLYVGVSGELCRRLREHSRRAPWWARADHGTTEQHTDWFSARAAERLAITDESPTHNQDRSLRSDDRVTVSDRRVTDLKDLRSLPQVPLFLGSVGVVTESDRCLKCETHQDAYAYAGAELWKLPRIGHCGHCPECRTEIDR